MIVLPAIDLCGGCAVRLIQGDYQKKTVYSVNPPLLAKSFEKAGAEWLHIVDLDGAKSGADENFAIIKDIVNGCGLKLELGGGIRSMETAKAYISLGIKRIILGTAAVTDPAFLKAAISEFGEAVAVGIDIRNEKVAIKGWTEQSGMNADEFCESLQDMGVKTIICTDISKDGMMGGANPGLYKRLSQSYKMDFIASGGVSSLENIRELSRLGLYGAIVGKALYTGAFGLPAAIAAGKGERG